MRRLVVLVFLILCPAGTQAAEILGISKWPRPTATQNFNIVGTATQAVSLANQGRLFVDSDDGLLYFSWNTGAYAAIGTVSGSGAANRCAYWSGASTLTSDVDCQFDGTNLTLGAASSLIVGANTLIGTTAGKLNAVHLAIASQAIGDLLCADSTTSFARTAAVATGQVYSSQGVGACGAWSASPTVTGALTAVSFTTTGGTPANHELTFGSAGVVRSPTNFGIAIGAGTADWVFDDTSLKPGTAGGGSLGTVATPIASIHANGALNLQAATNQIVLDSDAAVNTGTITMAALTAARTWTFPDAPGTITVLGNTSTGSGSIVLATSATLVTPALGTPASGVATNLTGTAAGLTAGNVTTNANLTGPITSTGNATAVAAQTGTGSTFVMQASPTLTTPVLGVASATSLALGGATPTTITNIRVYSQTITPASVAATACAEQTFTVTGLTTADKVFINPAATGNSTSADQVRVSAADTLAVTYCNPSAGALTPAAGIMAIVAIRS